MFKKIFKKIYLNKKVWLLSILEKGNQFITI